MRCISCPASTVSLSIAQFDPLLQDAAWNTKYEQLVKYNQQLAKLCTQNPQEFRRVALAAVQLGSRPQDLQVDVHEATEFCAKMLS